MSDDIQPTLSWLTRMRWTGASGGATAGAATKAAAVGGGATATGASATGADQAVAVQREPEKFHFVKGFHRGLELFGQQASRLREPGCRDFVREVGLVVVP